MIGNYLVVMGPLNEDEICHPLQSFETFEEAEEYSKGIFQVIEIPEVVESIKDLEDEANSNFMKDAI